MASARCIFVPGHYFLEFFFCKIKNLRCQGFVRVDVSVQRRIPHIGSDIFVAVVVVVSVAIIVFAATFPRFTIGVCFELGRLFLGGSTGLATFLLGTTIGTRIVPVILVAILFLDSFLSFDVAVSFTNELCQHHVKSLVSSPGSGQVPKGSPGNAREHQYFHPNQLSLPALELGGGVVDGKHSPCPAFFVSMPSRRFERIKTVLEMCNQWEFPLGFVWFGSCCYCCCSIALITVAVLVVLIYILVLCGIFVSTTILDKIEALGKNVVVDTTTLRGWRNARVFHLWNRRGLSFHGLEVRLAHLVEISLGLFGATQNLAGFRLGSVPLAETLRFDNAVAAFDPAVAAFVFQKHFVVFHQQ